MNQNPRACSLTVKFEDQGDFFVAHCPELQLRDHGQNREQAEARLMQSIWLFLRVCADKGTLYEVLEQRGALIEEPESDHTIQIPLPLYLFAKARGSTQRTEGGD
jgi:hypothetical protein